MLLNMITTVNMDDQSFIKKVNETPIEDIELLVRIHAVDVNSTDLQSQIALLDNSLACFKGNLYFKQFLRYKYMLTL